MKGTITQYVTLGVMLFLLVLIVSLLPETQKEKVSGQREVTHEISKLTLPANIEPQRTN